MHPLDVADLLKLIGQFGAWDRTLRGVQVEPSGLSAAQRGELLRQLGVLAGQTPPSVVPGQSSRWRDFLGFLRGAASAEQSHRRHAALLQGYEALCDRHLPFEVSSVLLRHHSAIKRASYPPVPAPASLAPHAVAPDALHGEAVWRSGRGPRVHNSAGGEGCSRSCMAPDDVSEW